jgi:hypothetical protein
MWCRVALIRTAISELRMATIIRVKRISELGTTLGVTSNWSTLLVRTEVSPRFLQELHGVIPKDGVLEPKMCPHLLSPLLLDGTTHLTRPVFARKRAVLRRDFYCSQFIAIRISRLEQRWHVWPSLEMSCLFVDASADGQSGMFLSLAAFLEINRRLKQAVIPDIGSIIFFRFNSPEWILQGNE